MIRRVCGVCGFPLGRVFYWNKALGIWVCTYCAEDFDPYDLVIYFDFRKRRNGVKIQGLNYLEM